MFGLSGLEEIAIALGILVILGVLFLLWRMGFVTKETLPWIGGALAALGGWVWARSKKRERLKEEIEAKEKELAEREKRLEELRADASISEREAEEARADLDREREEHRREMLRIDAETEEEKRRIDSLPPDQLLDEFSRAFGPRETEGGTG